jgi:XTP/dITP diphosphohydrolase
MTARAIDLLIATTNQGKFVEVAAYLRDLPVRILSLRDLGNAPEVVEDGSTYEENALKKARTLANFSRLLSLADDSGLEVDALKGGPGIFSARYAGTECDDDKNNEKLLDELRDVAEEKRTARYICALALCAPAPFGVTDWTARAICEGRIVRVPQGTNGFGYDPLFFYPPFGKTFGEIDHELKATVSHRGKALQKLADALPALLEGIKAL